MEAEQSQNFNERLSQWVASQGFWFQIRYSMAGSGVRGNATFHLLRLGFRLLVFALLALIGVGVFLVKRPNSVKFNQNFQAKITTALGAEELKAGGVRHQQGTLEISRLAAQGGEGSFYETLEMRNTRFKMGYLDGLLGPWQTGTIAIARLDIDLRAGANNPEAASKMEESLFRVSNEVLTEYYEVANASVRWGYSDRTRGMIDSSTLKVQRTKSGWRLQFTGGTFSQNWLKNFEIVNLVVQVDPNGLVFEEAELKNGTGTVKFPGLRVIAGERPQVEGIVKLTHVALKTILPPALEDFLEGTISGDFKVSGSTNSMEGLAFAGQAIIGGDDMITVRDRLYLFKALSVVDYSRSYHRVDFREGSFQIKTGNGGLHLSEIDLKAPEVMTMGGEFIVRLPTQEEINAAISSGAIDAGSSLLSDEDELAGIRQLPGTDSDFTLRKAANEARRVQDGTLNMDSVPLFDRMSMGVEARKLQSAASERMSRMLWYEGMVGITLNSDAFERAPLLREMHPPDPVTGRIPIKVPLGGNIYDLTLKQAEDIYEKGRR